MGVPRSKDLKGNHTTIGTLRVDPATFLLAHRLYLCLANSSQTLGAEVENPYAEQLSTPSETSKCQTGGLLSSLLCHAQAGTGYYESMK
jgi:hypothetical protein